MTKYTCDVINCGRFAPFSNGIIVLCKNHYAQPHARSSATKEDLNIKVKGSRHFKSSHGVSVNKELERRGYKW